MHRIAKFALWSVLAITIFFVITVAAALAAARGLISVEQATGLSFLAFLSPLMMIGVWISVAWVRRLDEAAREAHKWAWFWGGTAGIAIGFVAMATAPYFGLGLSPETYDRAPISPYYSGALLLMGFATAGYGVAWAVWWLGRR